MNAEYLLDAIGLLDDDLIQEAEEYSRPRKRMNYRAWISLAACLAVVITIGYGITHMEMGGGANSGGGAANQTAAGSAPASEPPSAGSMYGDVESNGHGQGGPSDNGLNSTVTPESPSASVNWPRAIRVDGTVYWATEEYIQLEPEEKEVRYTTSFADSSEPGEDGQASFEPVGSPYVVLEDGTVAVLHDGEAGSWQVYDPVPPWEE